MNKYLILGFMILTGCSGANKNTKYFCMTALGVAQVEGDSPGLKVTDTHLIITDEANTLVINRSTCAEITENK